VVVSPAHCGRGVCATGDDAVGARMTAPRLPKVEFEIYRDYMHNAIAVIAWHEKGYLTLGAGGGLVFQEAQPGEEYQPLLSLTGNATQSLQSLADALAKFGIMPSAGDNAKELQATKAHLEDMRGMALKAFEKMINKESE